MTENRTRSFLVELRISSTSTVMSYREVNNINRGEGDSGEGRAQDTQLLGRAQDILHRDVLQAVYIGCTVILMVLL